MNALKNHDIISSNLVNAKRSESYWRSIRYLFPLKRNITYLNTGTMGIMPYAVLGAINRTNSRICKNGIYPMRDMILESTIAGLINASPNEIVVTKNVSEGINHACWSIPLKKGDEVILSLHEHAGGALPWLNRSRLDKIHIRTFEPGKTSKETYNNIISLVNYRTRVIAIPHISCTIGQVYPIKQICDFARTRNIITSIDGAQAVGMIPVNLDNLRCDFYSSCLHKWISGPLAVGFLYINKRVLPTSRLTHVGAYSVESYALAGTSPKIGKFTIGASRFAYGSFSKPLYDGACAAIKLYIDIGPRHIYVRNQYLVNYLISKIEVFNNLQLKLYKRTKRSNLIPASSLSATYFIKILSPKYSLVQSSQLSIRIISANLNVNKKFCEYCSKHKLFIRYVNEHSLDCIRISLHYYNTIKDINLFCRLLKDYTSQSNSRIN